MKTVSSADSCERLKLLARKNVVGCHFRLILTLIFMSTVGVGGKCRLYVNVK